MTFNKVVPDDVPSLAHSSVPPLLSTASNTNLVPSAFKSDRLANVGPKEVAETGPVLADDPSLDQS
jgi:hypothetical protein